MLTQPEGTCTFDVCVFGLKNRKFRTLSRKDQAHIRSYHQNAEIKNSTGTIIPRNADGSWSCPLCKKEINKRAIDAKDRATEFQTILPKDHRASLCIIVDHRGSWIIVGHKEKTYKHTIRPIVVHGSSFLRTQLDEQFRRDVISGSIQSSHAVEFLSIDDAKGKHFLTQDRPERRPLKKVSLENEDKENEDPAEPAPDDAASPFSQSSYSTPDDNDGEGGDRQGVRSPMRSRDSTVDPVSPSSTLVSSDRFAASPSNIATPTTSMDLDAMRIRKLTLEEKQRRRAQNLCLYCGSSGHYVNGCRAKKSVSPQIAVVSVESENVEA
ncbi:hypothetical protein B0O80DRAFT_502974 [Mortierella sp. GBAus27b]|nr:hypothetical protein B0O80DRAFT_502974 [Mortierella sp. GBAus27b]